MQKRELIGKFGIMYLMKHLVPLLVIALAFTLTGCSGGSSDKSTTESAPTASEEVSDVDPGLTQKGYERDALTDPALYDYVNKQSGGVSNPGTVVNSGGSDKIGKTSPLDKNRKYNLSGVAQIISDNKIKITSFNYNGSCGPIYIALAIKNSSDRPIAKLKEISVAQSNSSFDVTIPSNISLIQFELLAVYCQSQKEPISSASF